MNEDGQLLFNRFRVRHCLGSGGGGTVYLVEDELLGGSAVALKVFYPSSSELPEREITLSRELIHPNIVRGFESGTGIVHGVSHRYLVMEYIQGSSLRDRITEPRSLAQNLALLQQIAAALAFAHQADVLHRDVKPENVFLNDAHRAVLGDFGTAVKLEELGLRTQQGELRGTPRYLAPEVFRGEKPTVRSDIYSFGVLAYEVLHQGISESNGALIVSRRLPFRLRRLLHSCLAVEPSKRPPSMASICSILERVSRASRRIDVDAMLALSPREWVLMIGIGCALAVLLLESRLRIVNEGWLAHLTLDTVLRIEERLGYQSPSIRQILGHDEVVVRRLVSSMIEFRTTQSLARVLRSELERPYVRASQSTLLTRALASGDSEILQVFASAGYQPTASLIANRTEQVELLLAAGTAEYASLLIGLQSPDLRQELATSSLREALTKRQSIVAKSSSLTGEHARWINESIPLLRYLISVGGLSEDQLRADIEATETRDPIVHSLLVRALRDVERGRY